ncbi:MAG: hypothetical protein JXQ96_08095 [Cyclobacteriaceae bacterium]
MKFKSLYLLLALGFSSFSAVSQIIDDSTKLVYGAHSTGFTFERKIRENDTTFQKIDSTLFQFENFEVIKQKKEYYQDLGVNGSAMHPMYYSVPTTIGRTSGFNAYNPYMIKPEDFKYYDSKSPYMDLNVAFGGNGRSMVDFNYSRNVNPNWNVGFDISRMSSNRQVGEVALTGDNNNTRSSIIDLYTFYESKKKDYSILFHVIRFEHAVRETGGVAVDAGADEVDFFQYADTPIKLANAQSKDARVNFHIYQEYSLKPFFEVYHIFDKKSTRNEFNDYPLSSDQSYFDNIFYRTDSTLDASTFNEFTNEFGLKGKLSNTLFYGAYLKRRDIDFRYVYSESFGHEAENYLGGDVKLFITDNNVVGGNIEILDGGQYYLRGFLENKYLKASYTSAIYLPSFMSEQYLGNHYDWSNDFDQIIVNSIEGSASYDFSFLSIEPRVSITSVDNYVYFDESKAAAQSSSNAIINRYSVRADFSLGKHFRLNNDINYTLLAGGATDIFRVPDLLVNSKWYYESVWFNDYMPIQLGVNVRWQSAYFANGYDPVTQQFYVQNELETKSYVAADIFLNFKAKNLRIFAKMTHINQPGEGGYFATPFYPGQKKVFDIGCRWLFFD